VNCHHQRLLAVPCNMPTEGAFNPALKYKKGLLLRTHGNNLQSGTCSDWQIARRLFDTENPTAKLTFSHAQ
jgi:hypothetical protein